MKCQSSVGSNLYTQSRKCDRIMDGTALSLKQTIALHYSFILSFCKAGFVKIKEGFMWK